MVEEKDHHANQLKWVRQAPMVPRPPEPEQLPPVPSPEVMTERLNSPEKKKRRTEDNESDELNRSFGDMSVDSAECPSPPRDPIVTSTGDSADEGEDDREGPRTFVDNGGDEEENDGAVDDVEHAAEIKEADEMFMSMYKNNLKGGPGPIPLPFQEFNNLPSSQKTLEVRKYLADMIGGKVKTMKDKIQVLWKFVLNSKKDKVRKKMSVILFSVPFFLTIAAR